MTRKSFADLSTPAYVRSALPSESWVSCV